MGHPNRWVPTDFLRQNPPTKKKIVGDDIGRYFLSDIVGRFFLSVAKSFGGTQALLLNNWPYRPDDFVKTAQGIFTKFHIHTCGNLILFNVFYYVSFLHMQVLPGNR